MKNLIVLKFGGSSLSDLKKISNVVEIIWSYKAEGHDLLVVVSAMGAMTDELKSMANQIDDNPAQRELDMLLSVGERVSMSLLAIGLSKRKIDCVSLTGSQSGIITNDCHNDAKIIDIRPHRLVDNLKKGKVVIVAGYQGQSYKNEITTLGRGGSDTTAVALTAALGAKQCEIYSDVCGVYQGDPNVFENPKLLDNISFKLMEVAALQGARVLNEQAVRWAHKNQIKLRLYQTDSRQNGTSLGYFTPSEEPIYTLKESCYLLRNGLKNEENEVLFQFEGKKIGISFENNGQGEKVDLIYVSTGKKGLFRIKESAKVIMDFSFPGYSLIILKAGYGKEFLQNLL